MYADHIFPSMNLDKALAKIGLCCEFYIINFFDLLIVLEKVNRYFI